MINVTDQRKRAPVTDDGRRTMLAIEALHASVVVFVVLAATIVDIFQPHGVPTDLLGFVYGGAITYSGGRAAVSRGALRRQNDQAIED